MMKYDKPRRWTEERKKYKDKLTDEEVAEIRRLREESERKGKPLSYRFLAWKFDSDPQYISFICNYRVRPPSRVSYPRR